MSEMAYLKVQNEHECVLRVECWKYRKNWKYECPWDAICMSRISSQVERGL